VIFPVAHGLLAELDIIRAKWRGGPEGASIESPALIRIDSQDDLIAHGRADLPDPFGIFLRALPQLDLIMRTPSL